MESPSSTENRPLTIKRVKDIIPKIENIYRRGITRGKSTGWPMLDPFYTVATAQLTVVTGIPGSGKTEWLDALIMNLAQSEDMRFAVFSPENYPLELHVQKLAEKILGKAFSTCEGAELADAIKFLHEHVYFIGTGDDVSLAQIIEDARAVFLHDDKARGLVLDPWNEIEHRRPTTMSETEYISMTLTHLRRFSRIFDGHVWLVAHPAKLLRNSATGKYPVPTPYDISGSAHWRNKADVCITIHRDDMHVHETDIYIQKIRFKHVGRLGQVTLKYCYATGRYFE